MKMLKSCKRRLALLLAIFMLLAGAGAPATSSQAAYANGVYIVSLARYFIDPVTGLSGWGTSENEAIGQGMVESAVSGTAMLEIMDGHYYLTIRITLAGSVSNVSFGTRTSGTSFSSASSSCTQSNSSANTIDYCVEIADLSTCVAGYMYVEKMGMDVVFYVYMTGSAVAGSSDFTVTHYVAETTAVETTAAETEAETTAAEEASAEATETEAASYEEVTQASSYVVAEVDCATDLAVMVDGVISAAEAVSVSEKLSAIENLATAEIAAVVYNGVQTTEAADSCELLAGGVAALIVRVTDADGMVYYDAVTVTVVDEEESSDEMAGEMTVSDHGIVCASYVDEDGVSYTFTRWLNGNFSLSTKTADGAREWTIYCAADDTLVGLSVAADGSRSTTYTWPDGTVSEEGHAA